MEEGSVNGTSAGGGRDLLAVSDLDCSYGPIVALREAALRVESGEAVAVLGANGAGKSTLLKAVSGVMSSIKGSVLFEGRELVGRPPREIWAAGISHVPEGRRCFPGLSIRENLLAAARPGRLRQAEKRLDEVLDMFPMLRRRVRETATNLSGGQQQLVAIARGLMPQPKLLMIDEASLGLSPVAMDEVASQLKAVRAETNLSVLLVDQALGLPLSLCSRGYVLRQGRVVAEGPITEVVERTRSAYLA